MFEDSNTVKQNENTTHQDENKNNNNRKNSRLRNNKFVAFAYRKLFPKRSNASLLNKEVSDEKSPTVVTNTVSLFDGVVSSSADEGEGERLRWSNHVEYLLSIIGFVIDLGNVWRFPSICYQNGGGVFLIPYLVCLFVIGMPCMYFELAIGQYFQTGNISIWTKIRPAMKGIGYSVIIINIYILSYYMTVQAYAFYYLVYSIRSVVPWSNCFNSWNTNDCFDIITLAYNKSLLTSNYTTNSTVSYNSDLTSTSEFFNRKLLGKHHSTGFENLSGLKWDLVLAISVIFFVTSACLVFGIRSSGKAVYVTAILPFICLIVLLIQSLTLKGSTEGILYYLTPKYDRLLESKVWFAAAVQIFFSLGPGFGVLIAYSSYSPKTTNIQNLTLLCSVINCITSMLYGVVVFAGIGYISNRLNIDIKNFIKDGNGLIFIVYPEIITTFKGAPLFSATFFLMLITLGIDSAFGGMESVYTAIVDEFPFVKHHGMLCRSLIILIPFLTSLPTVTYGGVYVVQWLDTFAVSPSVLVIVLIEVITVCWFYGLDKLSSHIKEMNSKIPYLHWRLSWKFICPICLLGIIILNIIYSERIQLGEYTFPEWSMVLGWVLNLIALLPIPLYAFYYNLKTKCSKKRHNRRLTNNHNHHEIIKLNSSKK